MGAYYTGHSHQAAMGTGGGAGSPPVSRAPYEPLVPGPKSTVLPFIHSQSATSETACASTHHSLAMGLVLYM